MDPFSYLAGFSTFVCTLAVAHLLKGLSDLFEARERVVWSRTYLALWALCFPIIAAEWWIIFRWRTYADWSLYLFFFLLIKPILLYFAATLVVPRVNERDPIDLAAHLDSVRPLLFGVLAAYAVLDLPDTLLKGWDYFVELLPASLFGPIVLGGLHASAAVTRSRRYLTLYVTVVWMIVVVLPLAFTSLSTLG